jgi:Putative Actinobacterial Holin-X, holin superfamily III
VLGVRDGRLFAATLIMAVIQALFALISRSLGRITSSIFGWAVVALFGRTNSREQTLLSALVGAAAAWPVLLLGIAMPKIGTFLLSFVPIPEWVPDWTVRAVWIGLAVAVPFAVGLTMAMRRRGASRGPGFPTRSHGQRGRDRDSVERESTVTQLLRGIPITIGIAAAFIVVFVTVPVLRVTSFIRRRVEVHVPLVTDAASYDAVAAQAARTLMQHGYAVREAKPGWWMTVPSRILLYFGGPAFRDHIPQRLAYFRSARLEVALYPNALLLRGAEQDTAWAHGLVVEALTTAPALQTFDPGAQDIERQIHRVWSVYRENPAAHERAAALSRRLGDITRDIARLPVPYEEWQVVYRQALQLGRALGGEPQLLEALSSNGPTGSRMEEAQMATERPGESARALSNRQLISEITARASLLVRKEVDLAKAEIRADLQGQVGMAKAFGIAALMALLGLNLLLVAAVLALATTMPGWAAALSIAGIMLVSSAVMGYIGWRRVVTNPLALTRQTLKEDMRWVKERLA